MRKWIWGVNMSEIAILAPIDELLQVAEEACKRTGENIPVMKVDFDRAVSIAKQVEKEGTEVIISRGTIGWKIIESDVTIPVVQIPITGYDLLRTFMEARKHGKKIGIADTIDILQGIESIEASLECHVEKYKIMSMSEVETGVRTLIDRKIDVLIGKSVYVNKVNDSRVKTVMLSSGVESVIQAINEAKSLLEVRRTEISRTKQLQVILDFIAEGVLAVDDKGIITVCNPPVGKILNIPYKQLIGKSIDDIFVNSNIKKVISSGKEGVKQNPRRERS